MKAPKTFYVTIADFGHVGIGNVSDGYEDLADAHEHIRERLVEDGVHALQILLIDMEDGTVRDVTEDCVDDVVTAMRAAGDYENAHEIAAYWNGIK